MCSDLIDRQKALDAVNDCGICIQKILDIPSAEPERKWILCSDKMPKVRTDVLLAFEKNMAVGFYSHDCWNVNTGNGFYTGVFTDEDKPIAWMPLPEPWGGDR